MIEIPWQMCGPDTLGVDLVTDPTSPHKGRIPIPPMMDTQLDQIVIQFILTPLREKVVDKFEKLITPAKREAWWEVYLSAFILLNHIERLARHSVSHARTHTMPVSGGSRCRGVAFGANVMLSGQILQHPLPRSSLSHGQVHPRPLPLCLQRVGAIEAGLDVAQGGGHG
jgi:hypothetical protein